MAVAARVLVTGFEPFAGAPVNPTEWLVGELRRDPPALDGIAAFRAEVLPVDYAKVGPRLSEIGREFRPDIAIHFGLAAECSGFRLERVARNSFAGARADNSGAVPQASDICEGPETLASTLPLAAIHDRLRAGGLPVEWSDDAGAYLCNMVFTLSRAHACQGFAPEMSGFVHVPPTGEGKPLGNAQLLAGARIIIGEAVRRQSIS
ncbi:MAG: pyroglutamyl-peptidase I [Hyphomicrobiales bacterium]|nr:pyroglutamyl-peptidase I [Hyphomicrobiales bacterium]